MRRIIVVFVGATALTGSTLPMAHAGPPVNTPPVALAINRHGYVVGVAQPEGEPFMGVWNPAGRFTYLQTMPDDQSNYAGAINKHGEIAGNRRDTSYYLHPVVWNRSGQITELPGGSLGGSASGINDKGVVVGDVAPTGRHTVPAEWDSTGALTEMPLPPGATDGDAVAINDKGVVLVHVSSDYPGRALLWYPDGHTVDLATPAGDIGATPSAINDDGTAVGTAFGPGYQTYPVRWNRRGKVTVLGTDQGETSDIDDAGVVVGTIIDPTGLNAAVTWGPGGEQTALPAAPNFISSQAFGINKAGDVVGYLEVQGTISAVEWTADGRLVYLH